MNIIFISALSFSYLKAFFFCIDRVKLMSFGRIPSVLLFLTYTARIFELCQENKVLTEKTGPLDNGKTNELSAVYFPQSN